MANTTGNDRLFTVPWTTDFMLKLSNAVPGSNTTFYSGQAVGRDASGNMVQIDDTAKAEFVGILVDLVETQVLSSDSVGDKQFIIDRPLNFTALIASAAAGDEGRKVYWKFNNEVSYSPGSYGNLAGTVLFVRDSTHVTVLPPWLQGYNEGGDRGTFTAAAAADTTLTKWDANKLIILPLTASQNINLPAANSVSPADKITMVNTTANTSTPTIVPNGSDKINGASSYTMATAQYSHAVFRSDGVSNWYIEVPGPSGTVGATTFSGAVAVNSTLTVTSASASSVMVGRQGATNPGLQVDNSTSTCVTGVKIKPAAAAAGVAVSVISSGTDESLTIDAKGAGTITLQGTATGGITIGQTITMADAKNIVLNATTGTKIGTATSQKLGFYNATPVVQPVASTDVTGFVAGSGTASKSDSVWAGASGASAYTVGGIVTALKALGLLAA